MRWLPTLLLTVALLPGTAAGGQIVQVMTVPSMTTDWTKTLMFDAFDPMQGTLQNITISESVAVRADFTMTFKGATATQYLATTATTDTAILDNPIAVSKLTDGPSAAVLLNGNTLVSAMAPVFVVKRTAMNVTLSSFLPPTDPNHITPQDITVMKSTKISSGLFNDFTGTDKVGLEAMARSVSSFVSNGSGSGATFVKVGDTITLTYNFKGAAVPEPSSQLLLLIGLSAVGGWMSLRSVTKRKSGQSWVLHPPDWPAAISEAREAPNRGLSGPRTDLTSTRDEHQA